MKKILYFDTETTGLDPLKNGIIQFSGIIEIDNKVEEEFNFKIRPFETDEINSEALEVNNVTKDQLKTFPTAEKSYILIEKLFNTYIDRYDSTDKFSPAGYNVRFDLEFLSKYFTKNNNIYFGSYCNWRSIDALSLLYFLDYIGYLKLENYKLNTVCDYFKIPIKAHDAMSDIKATRNLIIKLKSLLKNI